jgi:hypothetical protein
LISDLGVEYADMRQESCGGLGARRCSRLGQLLQALFVFATIFGLAGPSEAQQPTVLRYRFAIGDSTHEQATGSVWLYSYSWYGLQSLKLGDIVNGLAEIPTDMEKIRSGLDPHPNTDAFVLVLQFPQNVWFRSPDIEPATVWAKLWEDFNRLGQSTSLAGGDTLVVLPQPVERRITLLHEDGRPVANFRLNPSIYLWNSNHCGFHMGLALGEHVTDQSGTIEVVAPLVPLYLDGLFYAENKGPGPAGTEYEANSGMKLGSEATITVRKALIDDFSYQEFSLRVLDSDGTPLKDLDIARAERTGGCDGTDRIAKTDSEGWVHIQLTPQLVGQIMIFRGDKQILALTTDQLRELFANKTLTVKL